MEPRLQPVLSREPLTQTTTTVAERQNRVLRNTYWLLALSMLPTIAGAGVGMQMNFAALFAASHGGGTLTQELLEREILATKPLSVMLAEQVQALRDWARDRTVSAE